MSSMEEMLARIFKQVLPESFIQLMSQESIERIRLRISTEWQEVKDQLNRIETNTEAMMLQNNTAGYGARIFAAEGLLIDSDKEPEDVLRVEAQDIPDDRDNGIGNALPGWEQFEQPKQLNGSGSRTSSHGSANNSTSS